MTHERGVEPTATWVRVVTRDLIYCDACGQIIKQGAYYVHIVRGASDQRDNETRCVPCHHGTYPPHELIQ